MTLRNYQPDSKSHQCYQEMYQNQTYSFAQQKLHQYATFDRAQMRMTEVLQAMNEFVDPSDPDLDLPNITHAYQTAERIRRDHPGDRAFQVCGLIHDLGKILYRFGEPSWAVVGDTYVVGCQFPPTVVYYDDVRNNPDTRDPVYSTPNGVYRPGCGIESLTLSFGHDEYLYRVLLHNRDRHGLPDKYLKAIRFHSFYPWHTGGSYRQFHAPGDDRILRDVLELNGYDLYSKTDTHFELTPEIREYYDELLEEFFPNPLNW